MFFLAILTAESCEQFYKGCTQNYKDILGRTDCDIMIIIF